MKEKKLQPEQPIKQNNFDPESYMTRHEEYQTWVDRIYNHKLVQKLGVSSISLTLLIFLYMYLSGLALAFVLGFSNVYLQTVAIWLAAVGVPLVMWSIHTASKTIHQSFANLRLCVIMTDEEWKTNLDKWFQRLSGIEYGNRLFAVAMVILTVFEAIIVVAFSDLFVSIGIAAFRPSLFPPAWFEPANRWRSIIILSYIGIIVNFCLTTATRLIRLNNGLLNYIATLTVIPEPEIARHQMRDVSNVYAFTVSTWFVGVTLFGILFFQTIDLASVTMILLLSANGIVLMLNANSTFRTLLINAYDRKTSHYLTYYLKETGAVEAVNKGLLVKPEGVEQELVSKIMKKLKPPVFQTYGVRNIITLITGQAIALGSPLIEEGIKQFIKIVLTRP